MTRPTAGPAGPAAPEGVRLDRDVFSGALSIGGIRIELVEPGDVVEDPETGRRETVDENSVVVHRRRNVMFMTAAMQARVIEALDRENAKPPSQIELRATTLPEPAWVVERRRREAEAIARRERADAFNRRAMDAAEAKRASRNARRLHLAATAGADTGAGR